MTRTLREFRFVNATLLCVCLFVIAYILMNYFSYHVVITGVCSFIVGILWLTLIITDKKSKYYMKIKDDSLFEFVKIIVHRESKEKESLEIETPEIYNIKKKSCEHNYVKGRHYLDKTYFYQCSKCGDITVKEGE